MRRRSNSTPAAGISDSGDPLSTSSKGNTSSSDAASLVHDHRKVRMASAASQSSSGEAYDVTRSSDPLQPTDTSLATETTDPDESYEEQSSSNVDSLQNVYQQRETQFAMQQFLYDTKHGMSAPTLVGRAGPDAARLTPAPSTLAAIPKPLSAINQPSCASDLFPRFGAQSPDTQASFHSGLWPRAGARSVKSDAASSISPVVASAEVRSTSQVSAQLGAPGRSTGRFSSAQGAGGELTDTEWPPKPPEPLIGGWKPEALPGSVETGVAEISAAENRVVVHGQRLFPGNQDLLLYPVALLLLGVVIGVVVMVAVPFKATALGFLQQPECTSPRCTKNAIYLSRLLSWDDMSPCDDFYMFVCRRWTNQVPVSSAEESLSSDDDYAAILEEKMFSLLRNKSQATHLNVGALSRLFGKCMDAKRIEDDGWNPFLEVLFNMSLEGFPLTPPVRQSMSVWKLAGKLLRRSGTVALLDVGVASRPTASSSQDVITVTPPETIGSAEGVDVNELIRFYTNAAFAAVNALRKSFVPPAYTIDIAKFASELERLYETRDVGDFKVEKLDSPSPLLDFLSEALDGLPLFSGAQSNVLVVSPAFVHKVFDLVQKTEPHTVINFLCVRFMIQTSAFLPNSGLTDFYSTLIYGKLRSTVPRRSLCVRVVERTLSQLFLYASFVELNLHAPATKFADLVTEIVREFLRGIDVSPYFDRASRASVRTVVSNTRFKVLGPSWVKDMNAVERYAKNVPAFETQRPLDAYLALYEYAFVSSMLRGPSQRWPLSTFATRCNYELSTRNVYVPALLFNVSLPFDNSSTNVFQIPRASTRLGRVGLCLTATTCRCLLDMLLSTANSNSSSLGGEDGASERWLNRETRLRLREAERCFEDHDDRPPQGDLRDLLAARIAHGHFRRSASGRPMALRLPRGGGDEDTVLSEDQLFFVYLVVQSCHKQSGDQKMGGPHSGVEWNVALRSYRNFSQAFQCPPGSAMNPVKQCVT
ncbi:hypothetical protein V5799_028031 [Amblyomma americanum]|uniref:Peptidase M13 N-terminal domain-containing protein n=1 Tax=Amblyomma americanum TaxID=6943 RepID=A0AAQ4DE13_AMBAM